MSLLRSLRLALFAAFLLPISTAAQNYVATQPDNTLTPADPIGVPPQPSKAGTHEAVSNTNGGLSFFLPVLSLPQRGGWNLTLGYENTSPQWALRQDTQVLVTNPSGGVGGGAPAQTNLTYFDSVQLWPAGGPLKVNLPTLQASIEYTGDVIVDEGVNYDIETPVLCLTNWVFTDWSGNKHPFTNVTLCSASGGVAQGNGAAEVLAQKTDSSDGSWLRLDTSQYSSAITVRTKDGTVYTFPGIPNTADPFYSCRYPTCFDNTQASTANYTNPSYYQTFTSMVDNTGNNMVTWNGSILTDTVGRPITITTTGSNQGISYYDSNGTQQAIGISVSSQSPQNYSFGISCNQERTEPNVFVTINPPQSGPFSEDPSTYTITLPAVNGTSRKYTLQFDGLYNLTQITYPEGGYTKYIFSSPSQYYYWINQGLTTCSASEQQITQRRECPLSNGECSGAQELVTTYTPAADTDYPYNDQMAIQDPLGDTTQVVNQNMGASAGFTAPHEVGKYVYPPGSFTGPCTSAPCAVPPYGTPIRTIQTAYTPYQGGVDIQVPSQVTTTLNDISPSISAVTNYQYEQVLMTYWCVSSCGGTFTVDIDNPTEIDDYDYGNGSTPLKKTAQTWETGGIYDIAQGHLLDRLATRTVTDPSTNNQETLSYGYNSVGDITSKTVGGTGVTSLTTSYQRDPYGNITQMTDPKNNVTNFGYTNDWANSGCTTSASSAYLTSITDALSHVTKFSYYPCTGLKESTTDPNNQATTYTYDALGRPLNITRPDSGQTNDSYGDTAPNTVTESSSITSTLNKTSVTTLDGFGRTVETQLTSDPDGTDEVDTTYDSLGRVASVSNPYRTTSDSTYGMTYYSYDAIDRTTQVEQPDGINSKITTSYSGNFTTVTDEAGKQRKSETDALGRLTNVWEDPSGLNYLTTYSYNAFGDMTGVVQNGQRQRSFQYNGFSQLVSATNPENNTITYAYDNDGNLQTKVSYAENQTDSTATPATGSVTISGSAECQQNVCDTGTIYITVDGYQVSTSYGNSTTTSLASALTSQLNSGSSPVTATYSGPNGETTIYITSKATGPGANYSLSASVQNGNPSRFPRAAFTASTSGPNLTGGSLPPTVTLTYAYDKLNRVLSKTYTDGTPTVTYGYDGVAPSGCSPTLTASNGIYERTAMCDTLGWEAWSYNPTGHVTDDRRSTSGIVHDTLYTPNLDGSVANITYPITGRVVTYTPGGAGLPLSATDGTTNYAAGTAHYAPQGALAYLQNGSNLYSTYIYNNRLQPCWMYTTTGSALSWNSTLCTGSAGMGSILDLKYDFHWSAGDNGNVFNITNDRDPSRSQTYSYDSLNRITLGGTVNTSGTNCWGEQFAIDAWANITSRTLPSSYSGSCGYETPFSYTIGNNNQLPSGSGFTYDAVGNLTASGTANYVYNGDELMKSETTGGTTVTYSYDGDGQRIEKSNGTIYWYGSGGQVLDETNLSGSLTNEYVFFDGKRIARRDSSNNIFYYFADDLGTSREIVQSGQTAACYDADFYPYGGEILPDYANSCATSQNYKFTGKERDAESGLDDFGARYYSSNFGRFVSADWAANATAVPYANFGDPQSLNLYSYVRNNPTTTTDPDGHCCDVGDVWNAIDFIMGAANAYGSDNLGGAGRWSQDTTAGKMGATAGDLGATVEGGLGFLSGGAADVGGLPLDETGAGELLQIGGTALALQSGTEAVTGAANLGKDLSSAMESRSSGPKANDAPGVTAGGQATDEHGNKLGPSREAQVNRTRSNTRESAKNKARNEGSGVVEHRHPKSGGNSHFHPADNKGNKKPSSTHHEYPD